MDIAFTPAPRLVHLLRGEIFLEARVDSRPFLVTTREARFNVRHDQGATRVAVLEGRVEVVSSHGAGQGLAPGTPCCCQHWASPRSPPRRPRTPGPTAC
ncbi:FecR domain-containing protein [Pseudomonas nitroreducens]|uniref:FecR domain-containing protein n=1 Tax=Pseudomonas nitroreducens TaxID=46680 RepID=UPI0020933C72